MWATMNGFCNANEPPKNRRRDIQRAPIGLGVSHHRFCPAMNCRNWRFFVFLSCFMNFAGLCRKAVMACMSFLMSNLMSQCDNRSQHPYLKVRYPLKSNSDRRKP
jgi:hypothetical protein